MSEHESPKRAPNADSSWSSRAKRLWSDTFRLIPAEDWRPDEIELLRQMCQAITDLSIIEDALVGAELILPGSHGGKIANPLLSERRQLRSLILSIQKALKLPMMDELTDDEDSELPEGVITFPDRKPQPMSRSESARKAAYAKHGKPWNG